jgi:hypothetical protein
VNCFHVLLLHGALWLGIIISLLLLLPPLRVKLQMHIST